MTPPRPKLTVATSFPIFPPRGGGQQRVAGLYSALARLGIDVEVVSLVGEHHRGGAYERAPGLRELQVPVTPEHVAAEHRLQRRAGVPVGDLALALHHELTPAYGEALAASARGAAAVVACHPFPEPALAAACDAPLIYEAQDVEADLKEAMFNEADSDLLEAVRAVEAACCARADSVTVCAAEDGARLGELYGLEPERTIVVPNGVDPGAVRFTPLDERAANRARLGLNGTFDAVFIGSWHEPNLVAVRDIIDAATRAPDLRFVVVGSAGKPFHLEDAPPNVDLCGVVDAGFIRSVLATANAALNPMRFGSGTNLKMLDYALAGVPLVSSLVGARGLGFEPGRHYLAADPPELAAALFALRAEDEAQTSARVLAACTCVRDRFTWQSIAAGWHRDPHFRELLSGVAR
jgi:glycosyltransferase involved in cell wall biosynthesis